MTEGQLKAKRLKDAARKRERRAEAKKPTENGTLKGDQLPLPLAEAPVVEAPVVEAPVVEAPVVEAPVVEVPKGGPYSIVLPTAEAVAAAYAPVTEVIHYAKEAKTASKEAKAPPAADAVKAAKMVDLAATAAKPKSAIPPNRPIHQAFVAAGFVYARTQTTNGLVAHGYIHTDGRAALYTHAKDGADEAWAIKTEIGNKSGTVTPPSPQDLKPITVAQLADARTAARKAAHKASVSIERGKKAAEIDKRRAAKHEEILTAAKEIPEAIAGVPGNVVRAVEMLSGLTAGQCDLDLLRGDKHYGHRLALLKRLFDREKVLVAETGINNLTGAFFSAVGAGEGCKASKMSCFIARCVEIVKGVRAAKVATAKAEKVTLKQNRTLTYLDRVVPGTILPIPKPLSKTQQRAAKVAELAEIKAIFSVSPEQPAVPNPEAEFDLVAADVRLLRAPGNGIVMLQLEKFNSQGAICVYNNGVKVAAGVVSPETLKSLRLVTGEVNLVETAKMLLNPPIPSVPVTPVAARHLTAVINCKELIAMATTVVAPAAKSTKKFEANKATTKTTAVKAAKPAKAELKTGGRTATALYRLLNDAKATWSEFKSQKGIIVEAMVKAGAVGKKAPGVTSTDLAAKIGNKLTTAQPVERVVGFYMSQWQKDGIVEKLEPAS